MRCFVNTLALCLFVSAASLAATPTVNASDGGKSTKVSAPTTAALNATEQTYGNLPLSFEMNQGQADARVRFLSRGSGYSFFLTQGGAVLTFAADTQAEPTVLQMQLAGANQSVRVQGLNELAGKNNYFFGNDVHRWQTGVPTFSKVAYQQIYPGIDLVYYGNQRQLEYDFVVAPGANPRQIRLTISGTQSLRVDPQGNLVLHSLAGDVQLLAPKVYQQIAGEEREVSGQWNLVARNVAGFSIGKYDRSHPLVIDPILTYSSFLGGSQKNALNRIVVDAAGNTYVAGYTASGDFPAAPTPKAVTFGAGTPSRGAFVAKIDPTGSTLLYSTYLSGSADEEATGLAVDNSGNVYVAGTTHSADFPTRDAFQSSCATRTSAGGCSSAFLTKVNPTGDLLLFSTYLGGSGGESARGVAVDASGSAYVLGVTSSPDFPVTTGAVQTKCAGTCQQNAFVAKFTPTGDKLAYATYLGGSGVDEAADIAVDGSGSAYLAGHTTSPDFPMASSYQKSCVINVTSSAGVCLPTAFVAKINAKGSALSYSTYLGGSLGSHAAAIAVDSQGSAYVAGSTQSADFPLQNAFQKSCAKVAGQCSVDAFVTKFAPSGKTLAYSTYLGGSGHDEALGIAVDAAGNAHVVGRTESSDFPTVSAAQKQLKGKSDAFVARLNTAGSALTFSTYHGGSSVESGNGIAVDLKGNVYVTGETSSLDFPTLHPFQSSCAGTCSSAFVSKMAVPPAPAPAWTITKSHTDPFLQGQTGATYTITATNSGTAATDGTTVTVVDTVPAGLTATAISGTGWTCVLATATCTRTDVLAAGASYPNITLTVTVDNNAATSVTNSVQVSGGGAASPGSGSDLTHILYPIAIAKGDSGNFVQGRTGVTYTISGMKNDGNTATSGLVTVADTLPSGITATAMAGTGWTCTVATATCTRSDVLAAGASYPNITLTVDVSASAPASVVNSVAISGGGFTLSRTGTDTTAVLPAPVLSVNKTHSGNFTQGSTDSWTITVTNTAASNSVTYGTLTVTDVLPSGAGYTYTFASSSGTNWSCSHSGTTTITVTCTDAVDIVSGGNSFPVLTLTVNVPNTSPTTVSNTATASGAGALSSANSTPDSVTVTQVPASVQPNAGTPQTTQAGVAFGTNLAAIVKDAASNPVPGVTVTFNAPGSGASGTFAGGGASTTATTNSSGIATASTFTANCILGSFNVSGSVSGVATPATFALTITVGAPKTVSPSAGTPQTTIVNTAFATNLGATVADCGGNPVPNVTVNFAAPTNGASGTFANTTTNTTATTNGSGVATASVFTANTTAGSYQVSGSVTGATNAAYQLTNNPGPPATVTPGAGTTPQTAIVNTNFGTPLAALVADQYGNHVLSGITVTFTAPTSGASGTFTDTSATTTTANTNAAGVATAAVLKANTVASPSAYNVSATTGAATPGSYALTNVPGSPATITPAAGTTPQVIAITNPFTNALSGTVTDQFGNTVLAGIVVNFTPPSSGASGSFSGGASATTNASGVFTATTFTANNTPGGPYNIGATTQTGSATTNFSATNSYFTFLAPVTSTTYIQGQNAPLSTSANATVTVGPQFSYSGAVTLACVASSLPSGATCPTFAPANPTFTNGSPASVASTITVNTSSSTPVGQYAVSVIGTDASHNPVSNSGTFTLNVECQYSVGNSTTASSTVPTFTPSHMTSGPTPTSDPFAIFVTEVQGGSNCPWTAANSSDPTAIPVETGNTGQVSAVGTGSAITYNVTLLAQTATAPQFGNIQVNYFQVGPTGTVGTSTFNVAQEVPVAATVNAGIAGSSTLTVSGSSSGNTDNQNGSTLTFALVQGLNSGAASTVCSATALQSDGTYALDPAGLNYGISCAQPAAVSLTGAQTTFTLQISAPAGLSASVSKRSGREMLLLYASFLGLPAIVFLGAGTMAFGSWRKRPAMKRLTSVLAIFWIFALLVGLPSCAGGFNANFGGNKATSFSLTVMGYVTDSNNNVQGQEIFTLPLTIVK